MSVQVLLGDCRAMMDTLPAASVHCVVTSPPYYALRDYKTEPQVWGGAKDCPHDWGERQEQHEEREASVHGKMRTTDRHYGAASRRVDGNHQKHVAGSVCRLCGAWLGELGQEFTHDCDRAGTRDGCGRCYVCHIVEVFAAVHRVLHPSGCVFLNLGDGWANDGKWGGATGGKHVAALHGEPIGRLRRRTGLKEKDLLMVPHRCALALQRWGWYVRQDNVWWKRNAMPSSCKDRTTRAHEYVFHLTKSARYFYDHIAIAEPVSRGAAGSTFTEGKTGVNGLGRVSQMERVESGVRNKRSVWDIPTSPYPESHYAVFPPALAELCLLAGTSARGCCQRCYAPYRRVVARQPVPDARSRRDRLDRGDDPRGRKVRCGDVMTRVGGWSPTCRCDAGDPLPCTVLDPFSGSGTTLQMAVKHRRTAIGIDLQPANGRLMDKRLAGVPVTRPFDGEVAL